MTREAEKRQFSPQVLTIQTDGDNAAAPTDETNCELPPPQTFSSGFSKTPKQSLQDGTKRCGQDFNQTLRVPNQFYSGKFMNIDEQ